MELPAGQILVGTVDDRVVVRVNGRATHLHAPPLRDFAREMIRRGHEQFELDLGKCTYMDSTFLGVLVGISQLLQKATDDRLRVYRIGPKNLELFRTLGVDRFFQMDSPGAVTSAADTRPLPTETEASRGWASTVLEAHQMLVDADERNEPRFKDLLDYLKEDLARMENPPFTGARPASRFKQ